MLPSARMAVFKYTVTYIFFFDASEAAYGAVGYLRFEFKDRSVFCSFVMAKLRLAPMKTLTMPRLELNAAVDWCETLQFDHS